MAIPIEKSLLYIQPLYLAAEKGSLPELKRVIAAFGNKIAMRETLEESLQDLFGAKSTGKTARIEPGVEKIKEVTGLASRALEHYLKSKEFLRQDNWARFGEELKRVEDLLRELQKRD